MLGTLPSSSPSFNSEKGRILPVIQCPASGSPLPPEPHFLPHTLILYMHPLLQAQRLPAIPRPQAPASGPLHLLCPLPEMFFLTASPPVAPSRLLYNSGPAPHCYVLPSTAVICARMMEALGSSDICLSHAGLSPREQGCLSSHWGARGLLFRPSWTKMLPHHQPSPSTSRVLASLWADSSKEQGGGPATTEQTSTLGSVPRP